MKLSTLKIFSKFLSSNLAPIICYFVFAGIFGGIFLLYDLELEAVFYAFSLCLLLGTIVVAVCFIKFRRKHILLNEIIANVNLLANSLPETNDLIEDDYKNIIQNLSASTTKTLNALKTQRTESIDYYTTWVHQVKTPISVVKMILQSEDSQEHNELLAELFKIEQYVEMVLCFFRLDSSSNDFVFECYSLDKIIKHSVRKYASLFIRKRIKLEYEPTDLQVLTDEKWLGFIIEQLLSNAVKYTENGTVSITVSDKILCISDNGIGIAAEDLPRIFEKGYSGYNGRADKKATGLGLYLCKKAADKLSHRIYALSEVGKGTQICIDLSAIELQTE